MNDERLSEIQSELASMNTILAERNQLSLFEAAYREIRECERAQYDIFNRGTGNVRNTQEWMQWRNLFLQTLEHFCFLVNEGFIFDKRLIGFLSPAVCEWRTTILDIFNEGKESWQELEKFVANQSKSAESADKKA